MSFLDILNYFSLTVKWLIVNHTEYRPVIPHFLPFSHILHYNKWICLVTFLVCCFAQDSCQERNGRSLRVSTPLITNTGSPVFGSPTWRRWPAVRAGSKTITRSNYCWRCSILHTDTPLHSPLLMWSYSCCVLIKIHFEMYIHRQKSKHKCSTMSSESLSICMWTGAECVQREVQHAVSLRHDQRSPGLHSGTCSAAWDVAWFQHFLFLCLVFNTLPVLMKCCFILTVFFTVKITFLIFQVTDILADRLWCLTHHWY